MLNRLSCKAQNYAWGKVGKESRVAQLLGSSSAAPNTIEQEKPYAELWMGTHPSAPSMIVNNQGEGDSTTTTTTLKEFLDKNQQSNLPYLFKVLSIAKALSIQAHPDKKLAEKLHKADPAHYPDDNHKPELVVALTPFMALCCFRPVAQIRWFLENVPEFSQAVPSSASASQEQEPEQQEQHDQRAFLQPLLSSIYAVKSEETATAQQKLISRLQQEQGPVQTKMKIPAFATRALSAFRQVYSQFPDDVGCWMVFVLNIVDMNPGDGLFLAANEPHAYLSGDCVEIMAASDNVIRAGLTPKFKDVPTLVESLTYRTDSLQRAAFKAPGEDQISKSYVPPSSIPEFRLERLLVKPQCEVSVGLTSASIFIVIESPSSSSSSSSSYSSCFASTQHESQQSQTVQGGDIFSVVPVSAGGGGGEMKLTLTNKADSGNLIVFVALARGDGKDLSISSGQQGTSKI